MRRRPRRTPAVSRVGVRRASSSRRWDASRAVHCPQRKPDGSAPRARRAPGAGAAPRGRVCPARRAATRGAIAGGCPRRTAGRLGHAEDAACAAALPPSEALRVAARVPSAALPVAARVPSAALPVAARVSSAALPVAARVPSEALPVAARAPSEALPVAARVPLEALPAAARVPSEADPVSPWPRRSFLRRRSGTVRATGQEDTGPRETPLTGAECPPRLTRRSVSRVT